MPNEIDHRPIILLVDDVPENLALLANLLCTDYKTLATTSGQGALDLAHHRPQPDLILLDVMMSDLNGFEVCRQLKAQAETRDIPVIFLTSQSEIEDEKAGLDLGAVDYITKPISPALVLARVKTHLHLKASRDYLKDKTAYLEFEVQRRTNEIATIQDATMVALGSLAETRDNETGAHIRRTQHLMKLLAGEVARLEPFGSYLASGTIDMLYKSAPLHDIGKVGIPDQILLKPGRLSPSEFEVMKTHTTLGTQAIKAAEKLLDAPTSFLKYAREIAGSHHERWDGTGYPMGLREEAIPLSGRMMALVDVYDALRSERVYKPAFSHDKTVELMTQRSEGHFDPRLLAIFKQTAPRWAQVFDQFPV